MQTAEIRLLSVGLILLADDYGRGRANAAWLTGQIWGYQPQRAKSMSRDLRALAEIKFIHLYSVDEQQYYEIRNWAKHQCVDRPGKPHVPSPTVAKIPETLAKDRETLAEDLRIYGSKDLRTYTHGACAENSENGNRRSKTGKEPADLPGFEEFWLAYPKKQAKQDARKAWRELKPDAGLRERILAAVRQQANGVDWRKEQGRFIPHPASWLRAGRWEDEGVVKPPDEWATQPQIWTCPEGHVHEVANESLYPKDGRCLGKESIVA